MAEAAKKLSVYAAYLNSNKTRKEGRRIPKTEAVSNPNMVEMSKVLDNNQIEHKVLEKVYPREKNFEDPTMCGRLDLVVPSTHPEFKNKITLLKFIAAEVKKLNRKQFELPGVRPVHEPAPQPEPEKTKRGGRRNRRK